MEPDLAPLDPADGATVDAVLAVLREATVADVPGFPPPCPYAFRARTAHQQASQRREFVVARLDGAVAGLLELDLPMRDNLDNAEAELTVHPAYRRRGIGRAMHAHLTERLRELGRKRYTCISLADGAGAAFATAVGAKVAQDDVRRRLDLTTVDEANLSAMERAAVRKSAGYDLVSWRDRIPDEYVADVAYLIGRFNTDAPMGDLRVEPEQLDTARLREQEESNARARRRVYCGGAVHATSGRMVALTTIAVARSTPRHAFQWITLVDPAHRGKRLGALTKVGNLRFTREHEPELTTVDTWNAAVNTHMIAINEQMGFRTADYWSNWQQEI
jgi:GNAT superfamily N-acetyltransferase